ncbi:putative nuclear protein export protein Yrb2 [Fonsecaea pedrosoi]|nr:putative nuclear protein export protein Yrb2 [Fonsecaea pedrosoi]
MATSNQAEHLPPPQESTEDTVIRDLPPQEGSSDGEGGERTAREKLKKTSIAGLSQYSKVKPGVAGDHPVDDAGTAESLPESQSENGQVRGRPSKKRSFEDLQTEESGPGVENGGAPLPKKGSQHKRMRSREISGNDEEIQTFEKYEDMASPVQEESDAEAQQSPGGPGILVLAPSKEEMETAAVAQDARGSTAEDKSSSVAASSEKQSVAAETQVKALPSTKEEAKPQVTASSGFANTSTTSPFSSFKSPKSPKSPEKASDSVLSPGSGTSNSAFASSGLSAFAASEKSPFGAVGATAKAGGGFGGGGGTGGFASSSGGFGGASPFASKPTSGFGSGGGFGSAAGFGGGSGFGSAAKPLGAGLSPFGTSAGASGTFGKPKPFGAKTNEDEEDSEDGGENDEAQAAGEEAEQDPRFREQELNTGEEDEETVFSCRAKLYHFEREWKESGIGDFKINMRYEARSTVQTPATDGKTGGEKAPKEDDSAETNEEDIEAALEGGERESSVTLERRGRLIMRAMGTHRLLLNTPVFKEMNVGTHDGKEPTGKTMHLTGLEGGKPTGFQIKVGKEEVLKEIYYKIRELQEAL